MGGRIDEARILERIEEAAALPVNVDRMAEVISEAIRVGGGYRWVGLYRADAHEISVIGWSGPEPPAHPVFPVERGLCGAAVAARRPVVVGDVSTDRRYLTTLGSTRSEWLCRS